MLRSKRAVAMNTTCRNARWMDCIGRMVMRPSVSGERQVSLLSFAPSSRCASSSRQTLPSSSASPRLTKRFSSTTQPCTISTKNCCRCPRNPAAPAQNRFSRALDRSGLNFLTSDFRSLTSGFYIKSPTDRFARLCVGIDLLTPVPCGLSA